MNQVPPRRSVGCWGGLPVVDGAGGALGDPGAVGAVPAVVDVADEMTRVAAGSPVVSAGVVPQAVTVAASTATVSDVRRVRCMTIGCYRRRYGSRIRVEPAWCAVLRLDETDPGVPDLASAVRVAPQ